MLHITGCVVQVASDKADKAKKVADQKLKDLNQKVQEVEKVDSELDSDEEPMIDIAKQRKQGEEARTAKKLTQAAQANERLRKQKEQQKNSKALVEAAQKSVNVDVSSKISHRSRLNPPANVSAKKAPAKPPKNSKAPAKKSVTEPVSTMQASKKRQARQSVTEPVSTKIAPKRRKTSPAAGDHDQRSGLTMLNPPAKNNTDVAKGREVQIKWGKTVYNAKVTKVLDGGSVNVCTKDKDPKIAKTGFKIVRLTEEQAKSYTPGKQHGFTNKKANAGFEVAGAHDD